MILFTYLALPDSHRALSYLSFLGYFTDYAPSPSYYSLSLIVGSIWLIRTQPHEFHVGACNIDKVSGDRHCNGYNWQTQVASAGSQ